MSQKKKAGPIGIAIGVLMALVVLSAAGYVFLVQREEAQATLATELADQVEADLQQATRFIREHGDLEISPEAIKAVRGRITSSLPRGRRDVDVLEYLRRKARDLELEDFHTDIDGGMVMDMSPREDEGGLGPLASNPEDLRRSPHVSTRFVGTYRQVAEFFEVLGDAPWLFEIGVMEISRGSQRRAFGRLTKATDDFDLHVRLTTRYVHRCVQEPCVDPSARRGRR